ncbi:MAG: septum formation initiator family protein [Gemmatimonadota bacterium]|nr:septum formation initiator family protein [Gemmatimonadota bacterium]
MSSRRLGSRRQRRRRRFAFWALVLALLVYAFFVGDHRPHHLALLWLEERETEARIDSLRAEGDSLRTALERVRGDSTVLETLAREKGMIRPGDLVYRIVRVPPSVREAAAESLAVMEARRVEADTVPEAPDEPAP